MVLTPPVSDVPALIDALDRGDMPYVRLAPSYPSVKGLEVSTDDRSAARDMTRYLIGLGHRRIGFVAGHPDHGAAHERAAIAMRWPRGLQVDDSLVEQGLHSFDSGVHCGDRLLDRADRPSAIFAGNDDMAAGVRACARHQGARRIVGGRLRRHALVPPDRPKLTTLRQPIRDMAYAAVEQLVSREPQARVRTLGYEIVVRDSTRALG